MIPSLSRSQIEKTDNKQSASKVSNPTPSKQPEQDTSSPVKLASPEKLVSSEKQGQEEESP